MISAKEQVCFAAEGRSQTVHSFAIGIAATIPFSLAKHRTKDQNYILSLDSFLCQES